MIERFGRWAGHCISSGMAWFDCQSSWMRLLVVLAIAFAVAAWIHRAEIRREAEWAEFRAWQRARRRPLKGRRV
jgi:hypothetical protein